MKPENVNPKNFKIESIIYNDGEFSIAWGKWENNSESSLAARWNGEESKNGYPNDRNGQPIWFLISDDLKDLFLPTLLKARYSDKGSIIRILSGLNGKSI